MFIKKKSANFLRRKPLSRVTKVEKVEKTEQEKQIVNETPEVQPSTPKKIAKKAISVAETVE